MTTLNTVSESGICNMALARMGSTQRITSLDDGSNEAAQCAIWYPQDRDSMLSDYPFPWARAYLTLDQVAGPEIDGNVANAEWARTYRYPSDCLKIIRLVSTPITSTTGVPQTTGTFNLNPYSNQPWKRIEGDYWPITYAILSDETGRLVGTDAWGIGAGITAVYTRQVTDTTQFAPDFADALSWRLAADLAMGLGFDSGKREYAWKQYEVWGLRTRANLMMEQRSDAAVIRYQSETTRARWNW